MAIDDVISDYEAQISNGAQLSIQPASGDEWLVTHFFTEAGVWGLRPHTDVADVNIGHWGGITVDSVELQEMGLHNLRLFLTNSEYIKLNNATGSTKSAGYSAIKTKE